MIHTLNLNRVVRHASEIVELAHPAARASYHEYEISHWGLTKQLAGPSAAPAFLAMMYVCFCSFQYLKQTSCMPVTPHNDGLVSKSNGVPFHLFIYEVLFLPLFPN